MRDYSDQEQPFDDAIQAGDLARLQRLVAQHGGVERIDAPPVHMAVNRKQPELLEWLLSQGFDPNGGPAGEATFEQTPLFWATFGRERRMMESLARYGARVGAEVGAGPDELAFRVVRRQ